MKCNCGAEFPTNPTERQKFKTIHYAHMYRAYKFHLIRLLIEVRRKLQVPPDSIG